MSTPRILMIADHHTEFIEQDVRILRERFDLRVIYRVNYSRIRYLIFSVFMDLLIFRPKIIYFWFVMPWDTPLIVRVAKIFGTKTLLHVGGFDVARVPEIGYGLTVRFPDAIKHIRRALGGANKVVACSDYQRREAMQIAPSCQIQVLHPGVDVARFHPGQTSKESLVITVANVGEKYYRRKGLENFARCSKALPHATFLVIGKIVDNEVYRRLIKMGGDNLHFTGDRIPIEDLVTWYQRAKVYVQASAHEGFGIAVAEAMACECVPVVTHRGALPEVVGDTGIYTSYGDVEKTVEAISQALISNKGASARQRVLKNFTLAQRENKLLVVLNHLVI